MYYPHSEYHGGGPPKLVRISPDEANVEVNYSR
jgi:hypothetical protein